jgi:hypothetical protein
MHILDPDLEAGQWAALSSLTDLSAIDWVIAYSLVCKRNLVCGEDTRLDCSNVVPATSDFSMIITTLGRLYFVLSCWLSPPDVMSVLYGRHVGSGGTDILTGSHPLSRVGFEALWTRLLVGFWCENTCHVGSLDLSSGRDRTCSWHLARGATMTSHLVESTVGWGVGPVSYPTPRPGLNQGSAALVWYWGYPSHRVATHY